MPIPATCCICKDVALRYVKSKGYCKDHTQEAFDAARATVPDISFSVRNTAEEITIYRRMDPIKHLTL